MVTIKHVLHNVDKPKAVIKECRRVLKKGGQLAIVLTGKKTRIIQKALSPGVARTLGHDFYPYAEKDVTIESIGRYLKGIFQKFKVKKLESRIYLKEPDLYVDYLDSGRVFWGKTTDKSWHKALEFFRSKLEAVIREKGVIKDYATLGIVIAVKN